jgi:uncharacterized membrane protein
MSDPLLGQGPAQALTAIARRLRLPFDAEDLMARVAAHRSPRSLLALVEVAQSVGLSAHAFQADWSDLDEVRGPSVVHLQGTGDGSFVLLLEHDPDGVLLEAPRTRERVRLERARFQALWSGVVVLLERAQEPPSAVEASPGPLRTEASLGGPRLASVLGLALLSVAAAVRFGLDAGLLAGIGAAAVVALTWLGAAVSAVLVLASRRSRVGSATPSLVSKVCGRGSLLDCEGVLASKFSSIAGVELSVLGLALLGGAVVLECVAGVLPPRARMDIAAWLALAFCLMAPGAVAFVGLQVWPLRRFCPLCLTVHASVLAAAGLSFPFLGSLGGGVLPWAIVHAVAALGVAGLLVPFLEGALENRTHRTRLAWIGSTPWGALAEIAGRPPLPDWGLSSHARLGAADARFRADALVHPTCGGCPPLLAELEDLLERRPRDVQVMLHFPPRDPGRAEDRALCVALATVARLQGGPAALTAFLAAKASVWKLLESARVGGVRALLEVLAPGMNPDAAVLAEAGEAVTRADRVLTALRRGTPTLLLGGRPWDAPLEDFEALLAMDPDRLAAVLDAGTPEHA